MKKLLPLLAVLFFAAQAFAADGESRFEVIHLGSNFVPNGTQSSFVLDASNDAIEQVYTVQEAATVTKICFSYAARTGTPPTYKFGIETVSTSTGRASGTYKTGTGECSVSYRPPANTTENDTIQCKTLTGTTCSVAVGEVIALTARYDSGAANTIDASNNSTFYYRFNNAQYAFATQDYLYTVNAGAATKSEGYEHIAMFYGNSTRYWGNPAIAYKQDTFSGTTEKGLKFTRPGPAGQTYKCAGSMVCTSNIGTGDTVVVKLYSGGTTAIGSHTLDTDQMAHPFEGTCFRTYWDEGPQTLTFGISYNIGVTFTTNAEDLLTTDFYNNSYLDALPWGNTTFLVTRATQGGTAFTDVNTQRPSIHPIMDSIVATSSGSGSFTVNAQGGSQ